MFNGKLRLGVSVLLEFYEQITARRTSFCLNFTDRFVRVTERAAQMIAPIR